LIDNDGVAGASISSGELGKVTFKGISKGFPALSVQTALN